MSCFVFASVFLVLSVCLSVVFWLVEENIETMLRTNKVVVSRSSEFGDFTLLLCSERQRNDCIMHVQSYKCIVLAGT